MFYLLMTLGTNNRHLIPAIAFHPLLLLCILFSHASHFSSILQTPHSFLRSGAWRLPPQAPPDPTKPWLQALEHFLMHDDHNNPIVETFVDPSTIHDETNIRSTDFGNKISLSSWPLQMPSYPCTSCQILREITHTNGVEITKLEIHGRLGVICHAVLEKYSVDLTTNRNHEYTMFDFCKESMRRVKRFLVEYCMERKRNAYIMLQDPLSSFYEAICVGLDLEENLHDLVRQDSGDHHMIQLPYVERSNKNTLSLSIQRERTRKFTIRDLVGYFHLPLEVTAKKMQICPTVLKNICRKHGLSRWPYRKIKFIQKKISMRARSLTSMVADERGRVQAEIDTLQQEISDIYSMINV